jgi:hypothetical protein
VYEQLARSVGSSPEDSLAEAPFRFFFSFSGAETEPKRDRAGQCALPPVTMADAPPPPAPPPVRVQVTEEDRGLVWTAEGATRARDSSFRSRPPNSTTFAPPTHP